MFNAKRVILAITSLLLVTASLVSCATPAPEEVVEPVVERTVEVEKVVTATPIVGPQEGGTLIIGLAAPSIGTLDPGACTDRPTETVIRNVFDGLVTRTRDNEVVLELADSYEWVDDRTVDFTLKQNVTFHSGDPLTADDVVFTFDRVMNQDIGAPRRFATSGIASVEKISDYVVRFNMPEPWPPLLTNLVHVQIVPKTYVEGVGNESFARNPVGTGPFKIVEASLSDRVVMERFEDYYGGASALEPVDPPLLDQVIFKMMPEASSRLAALLAGEAHIVEAVSPREVGRIAASAEAVVKTCGGTRPKFMDLNTTLPPFDDVRVRRALNLGIDAEELLEIIQGGYGEILPGPLSPQNTMVDPTLEAYGYDQEKALGLLAEAGWTDTDDNGILDKAGSEFSMVIDAYGEYVPIAEAVAGQLRSNLSIDASVRTWDYAVVQPLLLACERQAFLRDWGDSMFDPVGYIEAKWHTRVEGTALGRANFSCYQNVEVDALLEAAAVEPDAAKRSELYKEAQRLIYDDAPSVWLYVPEEIQACSTAVQNWEPSPDSRLNMHDVWLSH